MAENKNTNTSADAETSLVAKCIYFIALFSDHRDNSKPIMQEQLPNVRHGFRIIEMQPLAYKQECSFIWNFTNISRIRPNANSHGPGQKPDQSERPNP